MVSYGRGKLKGTCLDLQLLAHILGVDPSLRSFLSGLSQPNPTLTVLEYSRAKSLYLFIFLKVIMIHKFSPFKQQGEKITLCPKYIVTLKTDSIPI